MLIDWLNDEWRPINGYEGLYEVSRSGKIRTVERTVWNRHLSQKILKYSTTKDGYFRIHLTKNGLRTSYFPHRIVCQTFNDCQKRFVRFKDGNKRNICAGNLYWSESCN